MGFIPLEGMKEYEKPVKAYYHPEVEDEKAYVVPDKYYFKTYDSTDTYATYSINSIEKLALDYVEKHGVILNTEPFETEYAYQEDYNKLVADHASSVKFRDMERDKVAELMGDDYPGYFAALRGAFGDEHKYFEKMTHAEGLYGDRLTEDLVREYSNWKTAKLAMYSANVFFFPAMNGEQHGNDRQSKKVLESALSVINKRIAEYEDEAC